jgi:dGTPase
LEEVPLWRKARHKTDGDYPGLDRKLKRHMIVRLLVDYQVTDLIAQTNENIIREKIESLDDVRRTNIKVVSFSKGMQSEIDILKKHLTEKMYRHPKIMANAAQAEEIIKALFVIYKSDPLKLHGKFKLRLDREPLEIIIADFIAGMTDRYAIKIYRELK